MPRDVYILGLFVPALVLVFLFCVMLTGLLDRLFKRCGVYNFVAHPALFCIAVLVMLFASISLYIYR